MCFKSEFFISVCDGRYSYNFLETNREVLLVTERKLLRYLANRQTAVVEINFRILDFSLEEVIVRRDAEFLLEYVNNMVFRIIKLRAKTLQRKLLFDHHIESIFDLHSQAVFRRGGIAPYSGKYLKQLYRYAVGEFLVIVLVVFEIIQNIFKITAYVAI